MVENTLNKGNTTAPDTTPQMTSSKNTSNAEILDNLQQSFENFLKNFCGLSDEDINAINKFMENDNRFKVLSQFYNELKLIYNNDDKKIKDFIFQGLLESYGFWVDNPQTKLSKNLLVSLIRNKDSHSISHLEKLLIESCIGSEGLRDLTLDDVENIIKELINYYDELIEENNKYLEYYKNDIETFENILNESYGDLGDISQDESSKILIDLILNKDSKTISYLEKLLKESYTGPEGLRDLTLDDVKNMSRELINYYDGLIKEENKYSKYYKKCKETFENVLKEPYGDGVDISQIKLSKILLVSLMHNKDSRAIYYLNDLLKGLEGLKDLTLKKVENIIYKLIKYYNKLIEEKTKDSNYYEKDKKTYENMLNELRENKEYKGKDNFKEKHTGNQDQIVNTERIIDCIENEDRDNVKSCLIRTNNHTLNRKIFEKLLHNYEYDDEKLMEYIDKFNGLKDSDLIDLYFRLYPDRYEEKRKYDYNNRYQEKGTNNFINDICINQIDDDRELTDFIDLIKTTRYWTDDVRNKCYDKARKMNMWCYIADNYAMGYFDNKGSIEKDLIENDFNGFDFSLIGYSPLFHDLEEFKDKVKKDTEWTCIADLTNNLYYYRNCIALMENRKNLGSGRGAINSPKSRHLL